MKPTRLYTSKGVLCTGILALASRPGNKRAEFKINVISEAT
jgi:hypothetical protein